MIYQQFLKYRLSVSVKLRTDKISVISNPLWKNICNRLSAEFNRYAIPGIYIMSVVVELAGSMGSSILQRTFRDLWPGMGGGGSESNDFLQKLFSMLIRPVHGEKIGGFDRCMEKKLVAHSTSCQIYSMPTFAGRNNERGCLLEAHPMLPTFFRCPLFEPQNVFNAPPPTIDSDPTPLNRAVNELGSPSSWPQIMTDPLNRIHGFCNE